ncbi:metalloregulator ArsR/SmtB family transcription factor [Nocardia halotolerans]|uniref:Metalloregulator ArsR/SmtB family transcription factor n=1 Tax=Nocardia halotolerans TaxID=1755878 RepID=A0ABV8VC16_9NOCA
MTSLDMPVVGEHGADALSVEDATVYAEWFACLADPTRVRLLHLVATRPSGITVRELTEALSISQPTVSHHIRKLADVGFVATRKSGTSTVVVVDPTCCTGLPHAADAVMGVLAPRPCCPTDLPADVRVRAMTESDWEAVLRIYGEGIGEEPFVTEMPTREHLEARWLPAHRWVAEIDAQVVGWAALAPATYPGGADSSVLVARDARERGVGKSLLHAQVLAADAAGLRTLQTSVFPDNRASIAVHHSAGFRTVGVRERIALRGGVFGDTVLLERRAESTSCQGPATGC